MLPISQLISLGSKNLVSVKLNGVANGLGAGRRFIRIGNLPTMIKDIIGVRLLLTRFIGAVLLTALVHF